MSTKLTNRECARRFDAAAAEFDARSNPYTLRRRAEALASFVRGISLELGGGTGAVTAALVDRTRAIHTDISAQMCKTASLRLQRPSICMDAECIPLQNNAVDSVIASEVIYYLNRPDRLVNEAYRVLRPGGRLIVSATSPTWQWADRTRAVLRKIGFKRMLFDDGAPEFLPRNDLAKMFSAAGFCLETARQIVVAPFAGLDRINRRLESTSLARLGLFMILVARKPGN